jgi:hypothetical protein
MVSGAQNCIAALALAWAYILSARRVEVMPRPCHLEWYNWTINSPVLPDPLADYGKKEKGESEK